jgi:DNA-binding GntR family transcriptional regulator
LKGVKLKVVKRYFASDIVYNELKKKIIELEYRPEETISEEMLSNELGVSRTPLRQALYRLELEGLIVKQSNGRMHVAPISIQEAEEIFKVREVLEGLIAREATKKITPEQINALKDILELMTRAAQENRIMDSIRYGSQFHHTLYEPSENKTAIQFLHQLNSRIERYRRLSGYRNPKYNSLLPVEEHERILKVLLQRDEELVEKVMRAHIRRSLVTTIETLQLKI